MSPSKKQISRPKLIAFIICLGIYAHVLRGTCSLLAVVPTPELVDWETCGLILLFPHLVILKSFAYLFALCFHLQIFVKVQEYRYVLLLLRFSFGFV